ncbi:MULTISPECIES: ArsR/SmtB family transcription factor [Sporolactobacillus]|jgi:ArsR family transcriptional regulator|uniref:Arsenical resistance operon repressor n=3 Tax=Sporolactobacillus TaxID=2077 RepID=A0A4Y1ZAM8_9BACL|nr:MULTISPECIES: metalloregulator ArsR/SmtB family transcription factor [Sporolactobacillus]KLI02754.1 transcriptional regulator [Sporolactobacillus inulinus CASD]QAA21404.1 pyruvate dehydrogenase complex transcriptional repressor PdhR [Sporolactobacillus terrae]QAA24376.1 pyruvate dehydrogenase complex transcriptional repressor PdhR [Sporolactobacillus terrae]UAK16201.1 metalloregulator ArsR/SmtB family transcription factor [Sporolactobacillus terrae]GAY76117.1 arsenical resistance operon rep
MIGTNARVSELAALLKLLGDQTRLTLLSYLKQRELCVCELVDVLNVSQPAISQHLKKLRLAGIVQERKQGTWVYYSLNQQLPDYVSVILKALPDQQLPSCDNPKCCE